MPTHFVKILTREYNACPPKLQQHKTSSAVRKITYLLTGLIFLAQRFNQSCVILVLLLQNNKKVSIEADALDSKLEDYRHALNFKIHTMKRRKIENNNRNLNSREQFNKLYVNRPVHRFIFILQKSSNLAG